MVFGRPIQPFAGGFHIAPFKGRDSGEKEKSQPRIMGEAKRP